MLDAFGSGPNRASWPGRSRFRCADRRFPHYGCVSGCNSVKIAWNHEMSGAHKRQAARQALLRFRTRCLRCLPGAHVPKNGSRKLIRVGDRDGWVWVSAATPPGRCVVRSEP